ncbi:MAG TPA: hypothetical protein VHS96_01855, partial [Bacteroidia bacterium]|nr:hypothetical protein [Bacteroidia bacterium]
MNRLIQYPIFALCICLLLWGCDPGSAGQGSSGSHVTDTVKTPGPGDSRGSRPWAADQNLLDPNALDGIADPLDEFLLPFSPDFLKARKLSGMEVRSYADSDNESLAENAPEAELQISRKRVFAFNGAGQFSDLLEERFLGDATPVTSVHMAWTYLPAGLLSRIDFEEKVGSRKTQHQRRLSYDPSNKLTVVEDAASLTTYYMYDAALGQTYLTRRDAAGTCEVFVIGKKGDF